MSNKIETVVREKYSAVAESNLSNKDAGVEAVAKAFGYTSDELKSIPADANMGLSCGNPTAFANLRSGEVLVDLGCGGGLDVFLASEKLGPRGKAIGIDMTPAMIDRAKRNAAMGNNGSPFANVEFHLASIDKMPMPNASVDVVISNCVINLASNKQAVFREIARVLKSGGRLAISDIALKQPLPPEMANDLMAYVGCISGAVLIADYQQGLIDAGFAHVQIVDSKSDLNAYGKVEGQSGCCSPPMVASKGFPIIATGCCTSESETVHGGLATLLQKFDVNSYAASVKIFAVKP